MSVNWTTRYALSMGGLVVGGFWLAGLLLSAGASAAAEPNTATAIKSIGIFALGVSLAAAATLLVTIE